MTDEELRQLLPDYIGGRLNQTIRCEIEHRLEQSAELRGALDAAKVYTSAIEAIEPIRAPDDFIDKVHRRIETEKGLIDRLFRPFHIKLPVELAGVAVTVMLVILLYNPFSGRLPSRIVERKAQEYVGQQEALPAPETEIAARKLPEERPAKETAVVPAKTASAPRVRVSADEAADLKSKKFFRKAPPVPSAAGSISDETAARKSIDYAETQPHPSAPDRMAATEPEPPSTPVIVAATPSSVPAAQVSSSSPPQPLEQTAVEMKYMDSDAEEAAEYNEPAMMRTSPKARVSKRKSSRENRAIVIDKERQAGAPASRPAEESRQFTDHVSLDNIAKIIRRYNGSIDTVFANRAGLIRLQLTLSAKRHEALRGALTSELEGAPFTDSLAAADGDKVTIILEVHSR